MFDVTVEGFQEMRVKLGKVKWALRRDVVKPAVEQGARIIAEQARAIVRHYDDPITKRQIAKNIVAIYRPKWSKKVGGVVYSVGVEYPEGKIPSPNKDDGVNVPHWHLLELGSEHSRPQPFLVPAAVMQAENVSNTIAAIAKKRFDKMEHAIDANITLGGLSK